MILKFHGQILGIKTDLNFKKLIKKFYGNISFILAATVSNSSCAVEAGPKT